MGRGFPRPALRSVRDADHFRTGRNRQGFEINAEKDALAFSTEQLNRLAFFDRLPKDERSTRASNT